MRNRSVIFESVLDDIEASSKTAVSKIQQYSDSEPYFRFDYEFQKECWKEGCDCLLSIYINMASFDDESITRCISDVRERFTLIIERRFAEHSPIAACIGSSSYKNKSLDVVINNNLTVGSNYRRQGDYVIEFSVGLRVDEKNLIKFIDLLANVYGFVKAFLGHTKFDVEVFKLRSADVEYTRQYTDTKSFGSTDFSFAASCLYNYKYFGNSGGM